MAAKAAFCFQKAKKSKRQPKNKQLWEQENLRGQSNVLLVALILVTIIIPQKNFSYQKKLYKKTITIKNKLQLTNSKINQVKKNNKTKKYKINQEKKLLCINLFFLFLFLFVYLCAFSAFIFSFLYFFFLYLFLFVFRHYVFIFPNLQK
ncbi:hypothetical protein [Mycoplasma sp. 4044]